MFNLLELVDDGEAAVFAAREESAVLYGFVDGAFRRFCCPTGYEQQRSAHSGHKKDHGQKWQGIVGPNGIVWSMIRPRNGLINDWSIWRRSKLPFGHTQVLWAYTAYRRWL